MLSVLKFLLVVVLLAVIASGSFYYGAKTTYTNLTTPSITTDSNGSTVPSKVVAPCWLTGEKPTLENLTWRTETLNKTETTVLDEARNAILVVPKK